MTAFRQIANVFNRRGKRLVSAEGISEQGHALQAAAIAERDGEPPAIVVAALLHDIGHMLQIPANDIVGMYASDHHEDIGAKWLACLFGPEVTEPVRLHVIAKRYLCATEEGYLEGLSNASIRSLAARGGPLCQANVAMFEANPYFESALKVRRIDDRAHRQHAPVAPLSAYASHIDSLMLRSAA